MHPHSSATSHAMMLKPVRPVGIRDTVSFQIPRFVFPFEIPLFLKLWTTHRQIFQKEGNKSPWTCIAAPCCLSGQSRPHFVLPLDQSIGHHDIQNGEQRSGPKTALFLAPIERLRLSFGCRLWAIRYKPCYPLLPPGSMPSKVPVSYNWNFQMTSQAHKASELLS